MCSVLKLNKWWFAGFLVLALTVFSVAQPSAVHTPHRLLAQLAKSNKDTTRINLLLDLSAYYFDTEWNYRNKAKVDSAWRYLDQAGRLADSLQVFELKQRTMVYMGNYFFRCDNTVMAEKYFTQVTDNYRKAGSKEMEARTWIEFGVRSPLIDSATQKIIDRFEHAWTIYYEMGNEVRQAVVLREIAFIYYWQGKLALAKRELNEVLEIQIRNNVPEVHYTYDLLARISALEGNHNIAIKHELAAIQSMEQTRDYVHEANFYNTLGRFYGEIGQTGKSIHWLTRSLDIIKRRSSPGSQDYAHSGDLFPATDAHRRAGEGLPLSQVSRG